MRASGCFAGGVAFELNTWQPAVVTGAPVPLASANPVLPTAPSVAPAPIAGQGAGTIAALTASLQQALALLASMSPRGAGSGVTTGVAQGQPGVAAGGPAATAYLAPTVLALMGQPAAPVVFGGLPTREVQVATPIVGLAYGAPYTQVVTGGGITPGQTGVVAATAPQLLSGSSPTGIVVAPTVSVAMLGGPVYQTFGGVQPAGTGTVTAPTAQGITAGGPTATPFVGIAPASTGTVVAPTVHGVTGGGPAATSFGGILPAGTGTTVAPTVQGVSAGGPTMQTFGNIAPPGYGTVTANPPVTAVSGGGGAGPALQSFGRNANMLF